MRILSLALTFALATPVMADLRADGTTTLFGLGVAQNGAPVALQEHDGAFVATIAPGQFSLTFSGALPEGGVTFGPEGLFDLIDLPPETGLFGFGTAFAREEGPFAPHFLTDPLCGSAYYGPGFNVLDASRAADGGYPVTGLFTGAASRNCTAKDRLPSDEDLLGQINPLYAVIRTDAGLERLVVVFVGS